MVEAASSSLVTQTISSVHKKFDVFLNAVIRDYVSADKIAPDTVVEDEDKDQNNSTKSLDFPIFM